MLSKIYGGLVLEFTGEKPEYISTSGYEVVLPNGSHIHFDWDCTEGNGVPGTNTIKFELTEFNPDLVEDVKFSSTGELVRLISSGTISEIQIEALDKDFLCILDRVKVKEMFITFDNKRYDLVTPKLTIQRLINIFWSNIKNEQVIEQTKNFSFLNIAIPNRVQGYLELMAPSENRLSAMLIVEPYGDALEELEPKYFAKMKSLFYQESADCSL